MIYLFSKTDCGPCILVKKLLTALEDTRIESINEILLDEGCDESNLELARYFKVTATPTMLVVEDGDIINEYIGGPPIANALKEGVLDYVGVSHE